VWIETPTPFAYVTAYSLHSHIDMPRAQVCNALLSFVRIA
jgi:hypothetical protein